MAVDLVTERVLLRGWMDADADRWAEICADPITMAFYERPATTFESAATFERNRLFLDEHDYGLWAAVHRESGELMGYVGIADRNHAGIAFMPCQEIGWRLHHPYWHRGLATEAALAVLGHGRERAGLPVIYSYTARVNAPSIAVMRRIGLHARDDLDFIHPALPAGHRLADHVVYATQLAAA
jgi:RimJ/RimL family protein N-acetyltransferase